MIKTAEEWRELYQKEHFKRIDLDEKVSNMRQTIHRLRTALYQIKKIIKRVTE